MARLLTLIGLTGFAISQPLLSVLGENPTVFVSLGIDGWRLVVIAVAVAIGPPLALWTAISLVGVLNRGLSEACFLLAIGAMSAAAAVQFAKWLGISSRYGLQLIALGAAVGMVAAFRRFPPIATWTRYLAPLPVLALVLFLFGSSSGALLGGTSASSASSFGGDGSPSVVMIVLDEFPTKSVIDAAQGIDATRFPRLAEFADDATWYRHYTSMSPFTASAIPSLLTGQVPTTDRPYFTNFPNTVFSLLAPTHDLAVFETATLLCNESGCRGGAPPAQWGALTATAIDIMRSRISFGSSPDVALDDFVEEHVDVAGAIDGSPGLRELIAGAGLATLPDRVVAFSEAFQTGDRPGFYYLHLMLPHRPWLRYASGAGYQSPDPYGTALPPADRTYVDLWSAWPAAVTEQRHLLQATYTDGVVGGILDQLKAADLYDESLVVVVADHGVTFTPRENSREPTATTIGDIAYVPLLIKEPLQRLGRIDDSNLMSIDVVPTIASVLGTTPSWDVDGAAAGSEEVATRGDSKVWFDITDAFSPELMGVVEFSDSQSFPVSSERHIGADGDGTDPLQGLFDVLNVPDVIGRPVRELELSPLGEVNLLGVEALRRPSPDEPPIGVVTGTITGLPASVADNGIFVLAVNGMIVTGSRISVDDKGDLRIHALLPDGVLQPSNELSAAVVTFTGAFGLDIIN